MHAYTLEVANSDVVARGFSSLLDCAPVSAIEDVRAVVIEELGAPPEQLWDDFSIQPIASASLAQVRCMFEMQFFADPLVLQGTLWWVAWDVGCIDRPHRYWWWRHLTNEGQVRREKILVSSCRRYDVCPMFCVA